MMETGNGNVPEAVTMVPAVYRFVQMARSSDKSKHDGAVKERNKTDGSRSLLLRRIIQNLNCDGPVQRVFFSLSRSSNSVLVRF